MPPRSPETAVRSYQNRILQLRQAAALAIARAWGQANVDVAAAERFANTAAAISTAAQTRTAALVDAYLAALLARPPKGIEAPVGADVRNGTEPFDVYHRAVVEARRQLADGHSWPDAMRAGRARATSAAETDVMLTERQAFNDWADGESRITGYRRVLTGRSCMFCATASTQRYHKGTLRPLHSHCDCVTAPIIGSADPGHVINRALLRDLKAAGGSRYWKARGLVEVRDDGSFLVANPDGTARVLKVAERQHGELGPVLVDREHAFTAASAVA